MNNKIEFTATSESVYEYLWLLENEFNKYNFKTSQLDELIDKLSRQIETFKGIRQRRDL